MYSPAEREPEIGMLTRSARVLGAMAVALLDAVRPGAEPAAPYTAAMNAARLGRARADVRVERYPTAGGVVLLAELTCWYGGAETRRTLTVPVGSPTPELEATLQAANDAYRAGLTALRPGALLGDVVAEMRARLGDVTEAVRTRLGESDDLRVRRLNPRGGEGRDLVVLDGMTFALEVGCDLGHGPVTIGTTALITEEGAIDLSRHDSR